MKSRKLLFVLWMVAGLGCGKAIEGSEAAAKQKWESVNNLLEKAQNATTFEPMKKHYLKAVSELKGLLDDKNEAQKAAHKIISIFHKFYERPGVQGVNKVRVGLIGTIELNHLLIKYYGNPELNPIFLSAFNLSIAEVKKLPTVNFPRALEDVKITQKITPEKEKESKALVKKAEAETQIIQAVKEYGEAVKLLRGDPDKSGEILSIYNKVLELILNKQDEKYAKRFLDIINIELKTMELITSPKNIAFQKEKEELARLEHQLELLKKKPIFEPIEPAKPVIHEPRFLSVYDAGLITKDVDTNVYLLKSIMDTENAGIYALLNATYILNTLYSTNRSAQIKKLLKDSQYPNSIKALKKKALSNFGKTQPLNTTELEDLLREDTLKSVAIDAIRTDFLDFFTIANLDEITQKDNLSQQIFDEDFNVVAVRDKGSAVKCFIVNLETPIVSIKTPEVKTAPQKDLRWITIVVNKFGDELDKDVQYLVIDSSNPASIDKKIYEFIKILKGEPVKPDKPVAPKKSIEELKKEAENLLKAAKAAKTFIAMKGLYLGATKRLKEILAHQKEDQEIQKTAQKIVSTYKEFSKRNIDEWQKAYVLYIELFDIGLMRMGHYTELYDLLKRNKTSLAETLNNFNPDALSKAQLELKKRTITPQENKRVEQLIEQLKVATDIDKISDYFHSIIKILVDYIPEQSALFVNVLIAKTKALSKIQKDVARIYWSYLDSNFLLPLTLATPKSDTAFGQLKKEFISLGKSLGAQPLSATDEPTDPLPDKPTDKPFEPLEPGKPTTHPEITTLETNLGDLKDQLKTLGNTLDAFAKEERTFKEIGTKETSKKQAYFRRRRR